MNPLNFEVLDWSLFEQFDDEIRSFYDLECDSSVADISDTIIFSTLTSGEDYE